MVGLRFNVNINSRRAKDENGKSIRRHDIEAKYFDERGTQLLNMNEASKYQNVWRVQCLSIYHRMLDRFQESVVQIRE